MQIVYFRKSDNPTGKLKKAERYGFSVNNGLLLGVSLIGELTEKDEEYWQANRGEVSCCFPATGENAVTMFQQVADEIGETQIDENYIKTIFDEDDEPTMEDRDEALRRFGVEV